MKRRTALVFIAGLCTVLAACGGSTHKATSTISTTSVASTTSTTSVNDVVIGSYRAFWDDFVTVGSSTVDPKDPRLAAHAMGSELNQIQVAFLARRASSEVIKGSVEVSPKVESVTSDTATVLDCQLDNTRYYSTKTGQPVDQQATSRFLIEVTLQLDAGVWKVSNVVHKGDGCTASS